MISLKTKLYVQLEPTAKSRQTLAAIQRNAMFKKAERPVKESELHLTIIHIGTVERLVSAIRTSAPQSSSGILDTIELLVNQLEAVVDTYRSHIYPLAISGYDTFGSHRSVPVVRFEKTDEIAQLHANCLNVLRNFIINRGISDPDLFMAQDANLTHALSLHPHVALAKHYSGNLTIPYHGQLYFKIMPIVYPSMVH